MPPKPNRTPRPGTPYTKGPRPPAPRGPSLRGRPPRPGSASGPARPGRPGDFRPRTPPAALAANRPQPRTSRQLAFVLLDAWSQTGEFPSKRLDELAPTIPPQERALAMELVYGVVRRKGTLDALLRPNVKRERDKIEDGVWTLLRIGAYQLGFLDGVPAHAAVHETVEVAKQMADPNWTGFLNAVLRKMTEFISSEPATAAASDTFPLTEGRFRKLTSAAFPDPGRDPAAYLASAFGFPRWMVERWAKKNSSPEELFRLGFWFNSPSPVWIRTNLLKTTREALQADLKAAGVETQTGLIPASLRLERAAGIETLPGFADGRFTVQDESAMHAALLLNPLPGETVLDLCAAPGTKTTHLAELMQNTGRIVATDVRPDRLARITENAQRSGATIIEPRLIRDDARDLPDEMFDAILIDVPCSNTGVLGRRPEVRWRLKSSEVREMTEIQTRLVAAAAKRLKPGGRLVYSTCSIEPEENQGVVRGLLDRRKDFTLAKEKAHVPGAPADGGYQALLKKNEG